MKYQYEEFLSSNKSTKTREKNFCRSNGRMTLIHTHLYTFLLLSFADRNSPFSAHYPLLTIKSWMIISICRSSHTLFFNVFKCVNTGVCICVSDCCLFFQSYLFFFFFFSLLQCSTTMMMLFFGFCRFPSIHFVYVYSEKTAHLHSDD